MRRISGPSFSKTERGRATRTTKLAGGIGSGSRGDPSGYIAEDNLDDTLFPRCAHRSTFAPSPSIVEQVSKLVQRLCVFDLCHNPCSYRKNLEPLILISRLRAKPAVLFAHERVCLSFRLPYRRARPVLARLGVPVVDGAQIVDGQAWASRRTDGRHYHPLVPVEVFALLGALISPPPPPLVLAGDAAAKWSESGYRPQLDSFRVECGKP